MSTNLELAVLIFIIMIIVSIIYILRKGRMYVKYSLIWLFSSLILLIFLLVPGCLNGLTKLLGFEVASNMIFSILIGMLMVICIALTVIVSGQNEKIKLLIQEVSLLKKKGDKND